MDFVRRFVIRIKNMVPGPLDYFIFTFSLFLFVARNFLIYLEVRTLTILNKKDKSWLR